jgi:hypothetical protein
MADTPFFKELEPVQLELRHAPRGSVAQQGRSVVLATVITTAVQLVCNRFVYSQLSLRDTDRV